MFIQRRIPSSFRDPSGFLFVRGGIIYRQVNAIYKDNYNFLIDSGLYNALIDNQLLVSHDEVNSEPAESDTAYKIIKPELLPFISYPYEWCFSQLKNAALTTLTIQKKALEFGMSLKDSSAYNIQFKNSKAIHIDTLSFERYRQGQPWIAYRQFCQHFLAPLALMSYRDVRLGKLLRLYIDGIPLELAGSLLPFSSYFSFPLFLHIHLHAKSQKYFANSSIKNMTTRKIGRPSFLGIIDSLERIVRKLEWQPRNTEWADYYKGHNYSAEAFRHKKEIISGFLDEVKPKKAWDLGANDGIFSRIAAEKGIQCISFDIDPAAVEKNYLQCVNNGESGILPLLLDLTNPSPSIGWGNQERASLIERGPVDAVFALALIHHLTISNNIPFKEIARFFNRICNVLIIEFIPKSDSQVQKLLSSREDIFINYTQASFENKFNAYFIINKSVTIPDSGRVLYLMHRREL